MALFEIDPPELRRHLYAHYEVREAELQCNPVYLACCRKCGRIVAVIPRVAERQSATELLKADAHVASHALGALPCDEA